MTLEELEAQLPDGLHDARLEGLTLDWLTARLRLCVRLTASEGQTLERRVVIEISGLAYCSIPAPEIDLARGYEAMPAGGLWIGAGPGLPDGAQEGVPATPDGCFLHWLFVHDWNRFILICARDAQLRWVDPR